MWGLGAALLIASTLSATSAASVHLPAACSCFPCQHCSTTLRILFSASASASAGCFASSSFCASSAAALASSAAALAS